MAETTPIAIVPDDDHAVSPKRHYAIDLETLGVRPGAVILSLAAVEVDVANDTLGAKFAVSIDVSDSVYHGLHLEHDTVLWWMQQADAVRPNGRGFPLRQALAGLVEFLAPHQDYDSVVLWGYGASGDNVWLRTAYEKADIIQPWRFWNDRCLRTLGAQHLGVPRPASKLPHNPLADAEAQAQYLLDLVRQCNLVLN